MEIVCFAMFKLKHMLTGLYWVSVVEMYFIARIECLPENEEQRLAILVAMVNKKVMNTFVILVYAWQ
jgi:hypothetical protein